MIRYRIILGGPDTRQGGDPREIVVESAADPVCGLPAEVRAVLDTELGEWHVLETPWPRSYTVYNGTDRTRSLGGLIMWTAL